MLFRGVPLEVLENNRRHDFRYLGVYAGVVQVPFFGLDSYPAIQQIRIQRMALGANLKDELFGRYMWVRHF